MKIVPLKQEHDCENIAVALRNIAADIESGAYDFDPSLAIVVLGRESVRSDRTGIVDSYQWQSHGLGKATFFASKGLLASALNEFDGAM